MVANFLIISSIMIIFHVIFRGFLLFCYFVNNKDNTSIQFTFIAWKVSKYKVLSGPYFAVLGLNTGKYGLQKTPHLDTFHAVFVCNVPLPVHCTIIYEIVFKLVPDNLGSFWVIIGTNSSNIFKTGNMVSFLLPVPRKDMIIFLSVNLIWRTILIVTFAVFFQKEIM